MTAVEVSGHGTADAHSKVDSLSISMYDSKKSSSRKFSPFYCCHCTICAQMDRNPQNP